MLLSPGMEIAGEIVAELLKNILSISRKAINCRSHAEELIVCIDQLLPIIQEIKHSGVELRQHRQRQLDCFSEQLSKGKRIATEALNSSRLNWLRKIRLAKKMETFEKTVSRFMKCILQAHVVADLHHVRVGLDERFDRLEGQLSAIKLGVDGDGGWLGAAVEVQEMWYGGDSSRLYGAGLEMGIKKVKEMLLMDFEGCNVIGIHGIGGSGKTTLAKELCRDGEIQGYFSNRVLFLTVSQSPNVEQFRNRICGAISGNSIMGCSEMIPHLKLQFNGEIFVRSLVVLDDVWSQSVLEQLIMKIPGCKFLVVSRSVFPQAIVDYSHALELLSENEAISLFCHSAFGQASIPIRADKRLVKEIANECKGLPLALKVIGAFLRDKPEMCWISAKNRLSRSLPIGESHEVQLLERMKMTIDCLSEKERECFLDLGAFPEDKRIPLDILINMWVELHYIDEEEAYAILVELSSKSLLNLVKNERAGDRYSSYYEISVYQHDVLRDLAIHLSSLGSVNQRRRLLMPRRENEFPTEWVRNLDKTFDARVISVHTGEMQEMDWPLMECPKTEVLVLNFSTEEYFLPHFLNNMPSLRALILINYNSSSAMLYNISALTNLTNLRSLWFEKITVPVLSNLTMPHENLRKISLILCDMSNNVDHTMEKLPNIFPRLAELTIDHCINLFELPQSICRMRTLKTLNITNCDILEELPSDLGKLVFLEILRLYGCPKLRRLPSGVGNLVRLKYLDISHCVNLERFPEEIYGCLGLEKIDMRECPKIKMFPMWFASSSFQSLHRVICDEEVSWQWKEVGKVVPDLFVEVPVECFTLDWLNE